VRLGLAAALAILIAAPASAAQPGLYLGADMSFVNEVEDCGGLYRYHGKRIDPFRLMALKGGNIVRVRIWLHPKGKYSDLADVMKTARRAKAAHMKLLLDFHYSDSWADGDHQPPPAAWAKLDTNGQAKALYDYTRDVLRRMNSAGLMPDWVQVGNETNPEMLSSKKAEEAIDWARNARLLNAGIRGVRDAAAAAQKRIRIMLHIAQPENILPWFDAATKAGVKGYDLIGISYYRKWSKRSIPELGQAIAEAKKRYGKDVILVETAYPFTTDNADALGNILGPDTLIPEYPTTPAGQLKYLTDVTQTVVSNGGIGTVWWEPAWVTNKCTSPASSGPGSPWDNATWFDFHRGNEALPAFDFLHAKYKR
jgi:arabinogalactan endo-1,4-beta-galactosidase